MGIVVWDADKWFLCMVGKLQISFEFAVMSVSFENAHRTTCDVRDGAKN
jgi:hypothetical protein